MKSLGKKATGERLARMQASPRWVDGAFRNVHPQLPGLREEVPMPLLEFFCPKAQRKPLALLPTADPLPIWNEPPKGRVRVTWLGHSTLLLEIAGLRLLTDPVWGKRVSPSSLVGPRRFQPMPVALQALPTVDAVLLSHDHYDHLDYPTIKALAGLPVPFIAPLGVGAHLEAWGVEAERITELDWWDEAELPGGAATLTSTPAQHFSGRGPGSGNHTLWTSYVIRGGGQTVFFGGDSGLTTEFQTIRQRSGPFDLALLEIGAHHPSWGDIHLGPRNALQAWEWLGHPPLLPIHWATFDLATHRWDQPMELLWQLAGDRRRSLLLPQPGQPVDLADEPEAELWWRSVAELHEPLDEESAQAEAASEPAPTAAID